MSNIQHEPVKTNNGGVYFNEQTAESYGTRDNEKGERVFFINFKNGTKIEYPRQSNEASIDCDKYSRYNDTSCIMQFNNINGGTIWDSPSDDHYYLNNSSDMNVKLDNHTKRTESYSGKVYRDYDTVYNGIDKISVIGKKAKVNESLDISYQSAINLGDNNNVYW